MKILGNRVLLEPIKPRRISASGILLPEKPAFMYDAEQWRVVSVGPGKLVRRKKAAYWKTPEVSVGDRVLVNVSISGDIKHLDDGRVVVDADLIQMKW